MPEEAVDNLTGLRMERKHIWVDKENWRWVQETFGATIGTSAAVRLMMKKFREGVEAKVSSEVASRPRPEQIL